ncbi:MAG: tRNA (adenosine(37)-N6)-threonylcarbamoyltransferase complex transferase subunit TsaD [Candidatus Eisenbacteria bacterium]|nr:tRNA (adenosine(37)-N6)-threonylcarbamoyltransferase complex transferase subunit TsaD [Candidatus Eisenbacteria bacterium]
MLILGIETSCDETAAAVLEDGRRILSNVVASQAVHAEYGGVVPEYASREHIASIVPIAERALSEAGLRYGDIGAVAVTNRPGLVGCLLVGVSFAKALAYSLEVPIVGVDHIEGHIFSVRLAEPATPLPAVCLVVSGGHTEIVEIREWGKYETLGRTRDDAGGEAFDKVGKLLGLSYPAGPVIEKLARGGDATAYDFPRAMMERGNLDFSFSGLKTAVRYKIEDLGGAPEGEELRDFLASFQESIVDALVTKTMWAAEERAVPTVCIGGGVAANTVLRDRLTEESASRALNVVVPPRSLCTDNGAVIAAVGHSLLERGVRDDYSLSVSASREAARAGRYAS